MNTPNPPLATTPATHSPAAGAIGSGNDDYTSVSVADSEPIATLLSQAAHHELPRFPAPSPALDDSQAHQAVQTLRRFHTAHASGGAKGRPLGEDLLPALLSPFRDASKIRYAYPLFLYPPGDTPREKLCAPLADWLGETLEAVAPGPDGARILRDNLARIEVFIRKALTPGSPPQNAAKLMGLAAKALPTELRLREADAATLRADLDRLVATVPQGGQLIGFGDDAALQVLVHTARHAVPHRRDAFRLRIEQLRAQLQGLLDVERAKAPDARGATALRSTLGDAASDMMNAAALSRVLGTHRGAHTMPAARRKRIESLTARLDAYIKARPMPLLTVVSDGDLPRAAATEGLRFVKQPDPCRAATALFDEHAAQVAEIVRVVRASVLEVAGTYDAKHHDGVFEDLDWEGFTRDELLLVPPVVALQGADKLLGQVGSLVGALASGRPVKMLVLQHPAAQGKSGGGNARDLAQPGVGYRVELGYLGMALREAVVHQTSAADPDHLRQGLWRGLDSTRASLHVVATGRALSGKPSAIGDWLYVGAAVEGRAHPYYLYDPQAGTGWARRFDLTQNPDLDATWPVRGLAYRKPDGAESTLALPFTFADFALLEPSYRRHFAPIPAGFPEHELIPIDAYAQMADVEIGRQLPYVTAVDRKGQILRLAVSRGLAFACRDRVFFWKSLQEMAGYDSEYIRQAEARAQADAQGKIDTARADLDAQRIAEVKQARSEAAGQAMERLAALLLDTDLSAMPARGGAPAASTATQAAAEPAASSDATPAPEPEPEPADDDGMAFDEPWVDTPLCTSCNDCINLNPRLFVYDGNKQAAIGDPQAGTFAQLVTAAEKCPSRAIHPGKPLNADEADLEALIKRAKRFN